LLDPLGCPIGVRSRERLRRQSTQRGRLRRRGVRSRMRSKSGSRTPDGTVQPGTGAGRGRRLRRRSSGTLCRGRSDLRTNGNQDGPLEGRSVRSRANVDDVADPRGFRTARRSYIIRSSVFSAIASTTGRRCRRPNSSYRSVSTSPQTERKTPITRSPEQRKSLTPPNILRQLDRVYLDGIGNLHTVNKVGFDGRWPRINC
jgi:hypothetical protein